MIQLTKDSLKKAIERAKELRPRVLYVENRTFEVESASGTKDPIEDKPKSYVVELAIINRKPFGRCTCKAGQNFRPCYHLAAAAAVNIGIQQMRKVAKAA